VYNTSRINWEYIETVHKIIRVTRVNLKKRYVDATDLETRMPISLRANEKIDVGKIKKAKIYRATVNVFKAEFTPEIERLLVESSMCDFVKIKALETYKFSGAKPTKFELIALSNKNYRLV